MGRIQVTDEWLYENMPKVDESIVAQLEENTNYEYRFSDSFERKMKKLTRRARYSRSAWSVMKVAAVVAVIIGSLLVTTISTSAQGKKLYKTYVSYHNDMAVYEYSVDCDLPKFNCVSPSILPEGYRETYRTVTPENVNTIVYENEQGERLTFTQTMVYDGLTKEVDGSYYYQVSKKFNGGKILISVYLDDRLHAYYESDTCIYEVVAKNISLSDLFYMVESVK